MPNATQLIVLPAPRCYDPAGALPCMGSSASKQHLQNQGRGKGCSSLPSGGTKLPDDAALSPRSTCRTGRAQAALDQVGSQLRSMHPTPPTLLDPLLEPDERPRRGFPVIQQLANLSAPVAQAPRDTGCRDIWGTQLIQARVCSHSCMRPSTALCPGPCPSSGAQMSLSRGKLRQVPKS